MYLLTATEDRILTALAEGRTYKQIAERMGIRLPVLHVHTHSIRQKTGIKSTTSRAQCLAYMQYRKPRLVTVTTTQRKVLERHCMGQTYTQIAAALKMGKGTAMNHVCQGCKRLGITEPPSVARLLEIREKLGTPTDPMNDPMF
jgi:DNA-binding NarL/FixJ family response regulator